MNDSNGHPNDVTLAVVGDGFGALLVYTTAVYLGFKPREIGIFGDHTNPVATYQQFAWNLGQTVLRSESESHFLPADWPTFAELDAYSRLDPSPLIRSVGRKFNPGVPEMLTEAGVVARGSAIESRVLGGRKVGWIVREPGPPPYFSLYDEDAKLLGRAQARDDRDRPRAAVLPGDLRRGAQEPGAGRPDRAGLRGEGVPRRRPVHRARLRHRLRQRMGERARRGRASASRCGETREPDEQDLNVPRCLFDGSGIDAFQGLSFDQRVDFLGKALRGTSPERRSWGSKVRARQEEGRFEEAVGEVDPNRARPGRAAGATEARTTAPSPTST